MSQQRAYLLGLGSNIQPTQHIALMVEALLVHFPRLHISRVCEIPPIGMNSAQAFCNAVALIESAMPQSALKQLTNQIEIALGRDRADPNSKVKDRTADIDILQGFDWPLSQRPNPSSLTDEYFLYPLIDELFGYLLEAPCPPRQTGVQVQLNGLAFGEAATTIYRQADACDKRIVE